MKKSVNLKKYINENSKLYFCDIDLFEFGRADESIGICKAKIDCHISLEEFIIQSFLVFMNEYLFNKNEELDINTGKLHTLEELLFKSDWKEVYELISLDINKVKTLLSKWIDNKTMKEMGLIISDINSAIMLGEFDSMEQNIIFEDNKFRYFLSRGLG